MKKVALIGAGISGLGMARALRERNIDYDHFEKMPELGGNWKYGVYENVHIISSKKTTQYLEYPMPDSYPDFPKANQMFEYLKSYAHTYDLESKIQFHTNVVNVTQKGDVWNLEIEGRESSTYHSVIIANGHHWHTRYPKLVGNFTGEILHSKDYKSPEMIKGKRVLVVGAGNSAFDIAVDAGEFSLESHISMRSGRWIIPKTFFGVPSVDVMQPWFPKWFTKNLVKTLIFIQFGKYSEYGLPEPKDEIFERHPTINSQFLYFMKHGRISPHPEIQRVDGKTVTFKDSTKIEVDILLFATGFHASLPMLKTLNLKYNQKGMPELIHGMFPKEYKNLYILGMGQPRYGAGPLVSLASEMICDAISLSDELEKPLGYTLSRMGAAPLEKEALDPFEVMERIKQFRKMIPFLPTLEKIFTFVPEFFLPGTIQSIRDQYTLAPPDSVVLKKYSGD
jgi:cation diffusion facilitator CzcD-associated flavoprotein CzcO